MIGLVGSKEQGREKRFVKNLGTALLECLAENPDVLPGTFILFVVCLFALGPGAYLVGSVVYQLAFDPNAHDVAARLDALSINPDKWIRFL